MSKSYKRFFIALWTLLVQFSFFITFAGENQQRTLFVRIIFQSGNVSGQIKDFQIFREELIPLGCEVESASDNFDETPTDRVADINIFIELPADRYLQFGKENYLMPNPEIFYRDAESIPYFDKILCRTQDVINIFPLCTLTCIF